MKLIQICGAFLLSAVSASDISLADAMDGKDADRMYAKSIKIQVTNPSPLHPMGDYVNDQLTKKKPMPNVVNFAAKLTSKEQMSVCERTRKVLFVAGEAPVEASLGGPVYEECMSALEPLLQEHNSKTKSTDVLNGCTGLINDLTANKQAGADPKNICSLLMDQLHPTVPPPKPKMALKPPATTARGSTEPNALTTVCALTIKAALKNVKTEGDAMRLGSTVAPVCQKLAKEKLTENATAAPANIQEWCYELDGRLTLAIETGYLFALHPTEALQQANEPNPYAQETRQRFCERFVTAVEHEKSAAKPLPKIAVPAPAAQKTAPASPQVAPEAVAKLPATVAAPAQKAMPMQTMKLKASNTVPASVDMLGLMQQLSHVPQWNSLCLGLLGSLTSEEGAVTEEFALGDAETRAASLVLTFNAGDQSQIAKCSTNLKVLAIRSKVLGVQSNAEGHHQMSALSIAERAESELQNTEAMSELIDSPWARDACADLAHGYLVAHLAHPDLTKEAFCPMYAKDLNRMKSVIVTESKPATKMPVPANTAIADSKLADDIAKKKAVDFKAQALKQLRSRQAAELAAKAKAAEEKKKLEQQEQQKRQQQKAEIADAEQSGSMFLRDMAKANAKNADAAEFELKHPDGDSFWSQFSQPASKKQVAVQRVTAKPVPSIITKAIPDVPTPVVAVATKAAAKPAPAAASSKAALLPVDTQADVDSGFADMFGGDAAVATDAVPAVPAAPAAKAGDDVAGTPADGAADGADGSDGAEFWKQMFQR